MFERVQEIRFGFGFGFGRRSWSAVRLVRDGCKALCVARYMWLSEWCVRTGSGGFIAG